MHKFIEIIIDFIFPPGEIEIKIRNLSDDWLIYNAKKSNIPEFPFINSLYSYEDEIVKEIIWQIKYRKNYKAIKMAGIALYNYLINKYNNEITLIPIPISKQRRKERGYNQCELIINEILKIDKTNKIKKDFNILIRIKDIDKQTFKNRKDRIENSKNIFKVIKSSNNQKIIIIDDVSTTGSTLKEAREELLLNNYNNVETLTIAH